MWLRFEYIPTSVLARCLAVFAFALPALIGCGSSVLRVPGKPAGEWYVQAPDGSDTGVELGRSRLRPSVCEGMDLQPEYRTLTADDLVRFFRSQGVNSQVVGARSDLFYVDMLERGQTEPVRLRVAILANAGAAGRDLHVALLQHGKGRWGVHRSNLAVLGPEGDVDDIVAFAARTRLACWGVLTITGVDETFVVPGGYAEL